MRFQRRAFTLIEMLVGLAILLPLLLAVYSAIEFLFLANTKQEAQLEPVQQMRRLRAKVFPATYGAAIVYNSTSSAVIDASSNVNGQAFTFPAEDGTPGNILLFAVPEDFESNPTPTTINPNLLLAGSNPDGFPDGQYTVVAVYEEPIEANKTSRLNRNARRLLMVEWESVRPSGSPINYEAPSTIDLTALGAPTRTRKFDVHGVENQFEVTLEKDQVSNGSGGFQDGGFVTGVNIRQHCVFGNVNSTGTGDPVYDNFFDFTLQVRNSLGI